MIEEAVFMSAPVNSYRFHSQERNDCGLSLMVLTTRSGLAARLYFCSVRMYEMTSLIWVSVSLSV